MDARCISVTSKAGQLVNILLSECVYTGPQDGTLVSQKPTQGNGAGVL